MTPVLIAGASLAGRRWGPGVSGWLVGLPLTSAPVAFFLALSQGAGFAAGAALGTLAGTMSQAAFCVVYAALAFRAGWPVTTVASALAFVASTAALQHLRIPLVPLFATVVLSLVLALLLMTAATERPSPVTGPHPRWDLPARMVLATTFVLILTGAAPALGPRLTGLLSPFPIYGAVLAIFAHREHGAAAAASLLRGLVLGLFGFAAFFVVLATLLERTGLALAFSAALAAALALQAVSLLALRRRRPTRA
jgi:hypothetical protein